MILDEILFNEISPIGDSILKKSKLKNHPSSCNEMYEFLSTINDSIQKEDFDGLLIGNIFYSFVSSEKVRDRHATSRIFEDIFAALFSTRVTDCNTRSNPFIPEHILNLDRNNDKNDTWRISSDLASNKREKSDIIIHNYSISLKTLKGKIIDRYSVTPTKIINDKGKLVKNEENNEINVGSLSYRALLKKLISNSALKKLGDRKQGLGSASGIRLNMLNPIIKNKNKTKFYNRLKVFLEYVYTDDIYIVLKSDFHMSWYLIPSESFTKGILETYKTDESNFEKIWNRWEGNNLRLYWKPIIEKLQQYKLEYYYIDMNLARAVDSIKIEKFKNSILNTVKSEIKKYLN